MHVIEARTSMLKSRSWSISLMGDKRCGYKKKEIETVLTWASAVWLSFLLNWAPHGCAFASEAEISASFTSFATKALYRFAEEQHCHCRGGGDDEVIEPLKALITKPSIIAVTFTFRVLSVVERARPASYSTLGFIILLLHSFFIMIRVRSLLPRQFVVLSNSLVWWWSSLVSLLFGYQQFKSCKTE